MVRLAAVVLALCAAAVLADRYGFRLWRDYVNRQPPSHTAPLGLGGEILQTRETEKIRRVTQEHDRVQALVDGARARGLTVDTLDKMLLVSISMARQKQYDNALTMLNRIEVSIPRPGEGVAAARRDDPLPPEPEIKTRPVPPKRHAPGRGRHAPGRGRHARRRTP